MTDATTSAISTSSAVKLSPLATFWPQCLCFS